MPAIISAVYVRHVNRPTLTAPQVLHEQNQLKDFPQSFKGLRRIFVFLGFNVVFFFLLHNLIQVKRIEWLALNYFP